MGERHKKSSSSRRLRNFEMVIRLSSRVNSRQWQLIAGNGCRISLQRSLVLLEKRRWWREEEVIWASVCPVLIRG